mgnify:CR=1 FL=1
MLSDLTCHEGGAKYVNVPPDYLHPDIHELIDWAMYGPKNPRIEQLVWILAQEYQLRLSEIEFLILETLEGRLRTLREHQGER